MSIISKLNDLRFYFMLDILASWTVDRGHDEFIQLYSLAYFFSPADRDTELLATAGASVFTFQLSLKPNFSFFEVFRLSFPQLCLMFYQLSRGYNTFSRDSGVCHGDDVLFIFPFEGLPPAVETEVIMLSYTASEHDI